MKKSAVIAVLLSVFIHMPAQPESRSEEILSSLSEAERISQIFLVNVEGNRSFSPVEFTDDGTPVVPGGILLFSYNISDSFESVKSFIGSVQSFCEKSGIVRPYIAVDQEGGSVSRLRGITSFLPSEKKVAEQNSAQQAGNLYAVQAQQMKELGITLNLAPVAEAVIDTNREFLGNRTFGSVPSAVSYSMSCIQAYESNGIGCAVKHFPGNANTDPHAGLPEIALSASEVEMYFLLPFAFVLRACPSCVLMSHARISSLDENPAALSKFWITEVLQRKLGYKGLVISDDIFMGALQDNGFPPEKACVQAIEAGVDIIMLSEKKFFHVAAVLLSRAEKDSAFAFRLYEAERKVIEFKLKKGIVHEAE
ncbi:MAG: glycoside hydrolase family 3 protein [Treponema sp.]|nr:glycoside hydrolase family 3 protein [Treponema sp.]